MEEIMQTEPNVFYLPELLQHLASGAKADRNQIKFLLEDISITRIDSLILRDIDAYL